MFFPAFLKKQNKKNKQKKTKTKHRRLKTLPSGSCHNLQQWTDRMTSYLNKRTDFFKKVKARAKVFIS